jgi:hypothetical protein
MSTATLSPPAAGGGPRPDRDGRPVPRWARVAAHLVPLTTLPSGLWRLGIAANLSLGMRDHGAPLELHGWERLYLVVLSLAIEGLACLAFGLVRPWGERAPRRVPLIGGRRLPPGLVVAVAGAGTAMVTFVALMFFLPRDNLANSLEATDAGVAAAVACYAPLLLWGPLLGALTVAYFRRRCRD